MATGIDIGSNSLRVAKIECQSLELVAQYEKVVRTAEEIEATKRIGQEALDRIVAALEEAKERVGFDEPTKAVATAAFRMAKNSEEAIRYIKEHSGIDVEVIDEARESYYSAKGVEYGLRRHGIDAQKFLLVDIGGGSTEVIVKHRNELIFQSFPIGILTTIQKYHAKEQIVFGIRKELGQVKEFLNDIYETFGKPKILVGTGGTPSTVAALKLGMVYETYDARKVSGTRISQEDIQQAYKQLIVLDPKERAALVGVGREDAIIAGLVILEEILRISGYKEMVVSDEGVREGVALDLCEHQDNSK